MGGIPEMVGAIGGALISSKAGEHAAEDALEGQREQMTADERTTQQNILAQKEAQIRGIDFQREQTDIARSDIAPWREAGGEALSELKARVLRGAGEFKPEEDPGYQYGYERLVRDPLMAKASVTGDRRSGGILKALSEGASEYATSKYDNFLDRWQRNLAPLQSLSGTGVSAAGVSAGVSSGFGSQGSNLLSGYQSRTAPNVQSAYEIQGLQKLRQGDIYGDLLSTVSEGATNYLGRQRYNNSNKPYVTENINEQVPGTFYGW